MEFTTRQDMETFLRCHVNTFRYFGGVPGAGPAYVQVEPNGGPDTEARSSTLMVPFASMSTRHQ